MNLDIFNLKIADYQYDLPNEKIAYEPLIPKDASKLLIYKNNEIVFDNFKNIAEYLPTNSNLIFNNSKVIPARLNFITETNACIEIFLLEPIQPNNYELALGKSNSNTCIWKCFVGNLKKWKSLNLKLQIPNLNCTIIATNLECQNDAYLIQFNWNNYHSFAEIIEAIGKIPLPPYIKREAIESDKTTYQTIYAKINGSVAAPTAGLHFTTETIQNIIAKNIQLSYTTLHIGAGTFKPVKSATIGLHTMHSEYFEIEKSFLETLLNNKKIIAVGTTSCRTLESIYWIGVKLLDNLFTDDNLFISQWEVYTLQENIKYTKQQAIEKVLAYCNQNKITNIKCYTQIMIVPNYKFKMVDVLITNFHQPQSTLLLLVSAFLGYNKVTKIDNWKTIYNYALENNFRFLSYGDSSILFKN